MKFIKRLLSLGLILCMITSNLCMVTYAEDSEAEGSNVFCLDSSSNPADKMIFLNQATDNEGKKVFYVMSTSVMSGWDRLTLIDDPTIEDPTYKLFARPDSGDLDTLFKGNFSETVKEHMALHKWDIGGVYEDSYYANAYLGLPTASELEGNADALAMTKKGNPWIVTRMLGYRTSDGNYDGYFWRINGGSLEYGIINVTTTGGVSYAFTFYLSEDFFKTTKLDVTTMGSNVKTMLINNFKKSELAELYSADELKAIGYPDDYVLSSNYVIDGNSVTLKASFKNNTEDGVDAPVIVGVVYNQNGTMVDMKYKDLEGSCASTQTVTDTEGLTLSIPQDATGHYIATYAIDSIAAKKTVAKPNWYNNVELNSEGTASDEEFDVNFNLETQKVVISGTNVEQAGKDVVLSVRYISQPDVVTSLLDEYQYFAQKTVDADGKFIFEYNAPICTNRSKMEVKLYGENGEISNGEFTFVESDFEPAFVQTANSATEYDDIYDLIQPDVDILAVDNELWTELNKPENSAYMQKSCKAVADYPAFSTLNDVLDAVNAELATQYVKMSADSEILASNIGLYNKYLKMDLGNYVNKLKEDAQKTTVYNYLLNDNEINSLSDLKDSYFEAYILVNVNAISNYVDFNGIISNISGILKELGVNVDEYIGLSDTDIIDQYLSINYENWDSFVTRFNYAMANTEEIIEDYENESNGNDSGGGSGVGSGSGSGGSSGGGFGGGSSPSSFISIGKKPETVAEEKTYFVDLDSVKWATSYINNLAEKQIISGKEQGRFYPNDSITREEFVKLLVLAFNLKRNSEKDIVFEDVGSNDWFCEYVSIAVDNGCVNGVSDTKFGAGQFITREDAAVMLGRAMETLGEIIENKNTESFADETEFADYSKDYIYRMKSNGIINGKGENKFAAKDEITRAESAKIICMLMDFVVKK